ncbi:MAG: DUF3883 domain-containing protein, partial [Cyclobacteriaceae bacterium]
KPHEEFIYEILKKAPAGIKPDLNTSFTYLPESDNEKENIKKARTALHDIVPYVLVFNDNLKGVTIIHKDGRKNEYTKGDTENNQGVWQTVIHFNSDPKKIFTLRSDDGKTIIALPLSSASEGNAPPANLSRIFIHFPLIGTEKWGTNFIIHSKKFAPAEKRDGIYVRSNNPSRKEKEESNTGVVEEATQLIFQYLDKFSSEISNPISFAPVYFKSEGNKEASADIYYKDLKSQWVSEMIKLPLVDTASGRISPADAVFLSSELLYDENTFEAIHNLTGTFYKDRLPQRNICQEWTEIVSTWEQLTIISYKELCEEIASEGKLNSFDKQYLQKFYAYIKGQNRIELFSDHSLLPNTKGNFHNRGQLKNATELPGELLDIAYDLLEQESRSFIHPDFLLEFDFELFDKKLFYERLKILNSEYNDNGKIFTEDIRNSYIRFCSIFASDQVEGTRRSLMPLICDFYDLEHREQFLPNPEDDKIEFDEVPLRGLVKNVLLDISKRPNEDPEFINNNKDHLVSILTTVFEQKALRDFVANLKVYPNQLGDFCMLDELAVECPTFKEYPESDKIKGLYEEVVGTNIRSKLLHDDFVKLLNSEDRIYKGSAIGSEIETVLSNDNIEEDISKKKYKKNIISLLSGNKELENIFPVINSKKAEFMLAEITEGGIKDDVFSFLNLRPDQIKRIGQVIGNGGIDTLIRKAEAEILSKEKQKTTRLLSQQIGLHIERLVKNNLGINLQINYRDSVNETEVTVEGVQNGQDIIIRHNNEDCYFIEVKTRWSNDRSVYMSKNQLKRACEEKSRYALCAIDLSEYGESIEDKLKIKGLNEITNKVRFLTDIGEHIEPLVKECYKNEEIVKAVKLDISRGIVPQVLINEGSLLSDFINDFRNNLQEILNLNK